VSDSDYEDRMKEITSAEHTAQLAKRGIWSGDAHPNEGEISQTSKESFPVRDLYVHGVNAHRMKHADVYCLIGGDFCLTTLGPIVQEIRSPLYRTGCRGTLLLLQRLFRAKASK